MKAAFLLLLSLFTLTAQASSGFQDEIVCSPVDLIGHPVVGVTVAIQTNATTGAMRASVRETTTVEIAAYDLGSDQPLVSTPGFGNSDRVAIYSTEGFEVMMRVDVKNGKRVVLGPAQTTIVLPGETQRIEQMLTCGSVQP